MSYIGEVFFSDDSDTGINQFILLLCAAVLVKPVYCNLVLNKHELWK